jgi:hypothetical protein
VPGGIRYLSVLGALAASCLASPALAAQSRVHTVPIAVPAKLDFTLATLNLRGSAIGLRLAADAPRGIYFAAADERSRPGQVLILLVDQEPPGLTALVATSVRVRVQTRVAEPPPAFSQHVNILAGGAPGQDCSSLTYVPPHPPLTSVGLRVLWGYELRALASSGSGWIGVEETVAHALDQACTGGPDSQFRRWVRQEPSIPHP